MSAGRSHPSACIGIDLGGSNSFACLYGAGFKLLATDKIATEARRGYQHVISNLKDQIARLEQKALDSGVRVSAVGLAVPGIVYPDGFLSTAPNLEWKDCRPLESLQLSARKDIRAVLLNDVNAGLMGELSALPKPPHSAVAYFCGTGIGGAIAIEGRLLGGFHGGAGEVGHVLVKRGGRVCGCGRRGCLEAYIGKWALNQRIRRALKQKKATKLAELIGYDLRTEPVKSSSLKKAYRAGDGFTQTLMNDYYVRYLSAGISQAVNFINPEVVFLGGGIIEALGEPLLPLIQERLARHCINEVPQLRLASLGDEAGPRGAAGVAAGGAILNGTEAG